jgi:hypothetical protein
MKYNHMLDVAFTIETPIKDWRQIPVMDLIDALQRRVDYLKTYEGAEEAFGYSDTYEVINENQKV